MTNPDESGIIYFGTDLSNLEQIDKYGLDKSLFRQEQYISVCVSGYQAPLPCEHPELFQMGKIFSEELKAADFKEGYLHYHTGYSYSLTSFQGFGVCPNSYIHTFDGLRINTENDRKMTVVLSKTAGSYLTYPDKEREFEYLSLALHSFIRCIKPQNILGYIVSAANYKRMQEFMKAGKINRRELWSIDQFKPLPMQLDNKNRYRVKDV